MVIALFSESTGVKQYHTCQIHFNPGYSFWILIMLENIECQFGCNNAGIAIATEIQLLILQL